MAADDLPLGELRLALTEARREVAASTRGARAAIDRAKAIERREP